MGRKSAGWKFRPQRSPGAVRTIRFTWAGQEHNRSTGSADLAVASAEAARIYADVVSRCPEPTRATQVGQALEDLLGQWLTYITATLRSNTVKTWKLYAETHFLPFFGAVHNITEVTCLEYRNKRLNMVLAETVRKELTALRGFVGWLHKQSHIGRSVQVTGVPKRTAGTAHGKRRRVAAFEVSPEDIARILELLPEFSTSRRVASFPIRARFVFAYETSLRPETIDQLRAPEHYSPGRLRLEIPKGLDKSRMGRPLPLNDRARAAIDSVCPAEGSAFIFGKHDYREHIRKAAEAVLQPHEAKLFTGTHFRSARITHALENTANMPGVQFMAGHKLTQTTSRYVKASARAADAMLEADAAKRAPKRPRKKAPIAAE